MSAHQRSFLAEVRPIAGHHCFAGCAALAYIASQAIHTTTARAYGATLKQRYSRIHPFPQLATTVKLQVSCQLSIPRIPQRASSFSWLPLSPAVARVPKSVCFSASPSWVSLALAVYNLVYPWLHLSFSQAALAAWLSATFLLFPIPLPSASPSTKISTVNCLLWSGPVASTKR